MKFQFAFLMLGASLAMCGGSTLAAPGPSKASRPAKGDCQITHILADGRQIRSMGKADSVVRSNGRSSRASASASSSSSSSSHSSVSVSSSSSGRGNGHARAATSYTDEQGRQVTTVRDGAGCRITVDERDVDNIGEE